MTKINPTGTGLVYSTYLGGSGEEWDFFSWGYGAIAVDRTGNAYVTGSTSSPNFPSKNANYASLQGDRNAFITVIDAQGASLRYSTYLGGSGTDIGNAIAVDPGGNIYVAGYTESANFPTSNPLYGSLNGPRDAFVAKIKLASPLPFLSVLLED